MSCMRRCSRISPLASVSGAPSTCRRRKSQSGAGTGSRISGSLVPSPKTPATKVAGVDGRRALLDRAPRPGVAVGDGEPRLDLALAERVESLRDEQPGRVFDGSRKPLVRDPFPQLELGVEDPQQLVGTAAQAQHLRREPRRLRLRTETNVASPSSGSSSPGVAALHAARRAERVADHEQIGRRRRRARAPAARSTQRMLSPASVSPTTMRRAPTVTETCGSPMRCALRLGERGTSSSIDGEGPLHGRGRHGQHVPAGARLARCARVTPRSASARRTVSDRGRELFPLLPVGLATLEQPRAVGPDDVRPRRRPTAAGRAGPRRRAGRPAPPSTASSPPSATTRHVDAQRAETLHARAQTRRRRRGRPVRWPAPTLPQSRQMTG